MRTAGVVRQMSQANRRAAMSEMGTKLFREMGQPVSQFPVEIRDNH